MLIKILRCQNEIEKDYSNLSVQVIWWVNKAFIMAYAQVLVSVLKMNIKE